MNKREINRSCGFFVTFLLLQVALWGCSGIRSEIYRAETSHHYEAACKLYNQGDYETARSGFEGVIALDPDYGQAHAALGNLFLIAEDYPEALAYYQAAVTADPELEVELQPLIMVAKAHKERAPLQEAGISLNYLYALIMAERMTEVEVLLQQDIPLQLLANDTMGITPGRLGELQRKVAETADPLNGSVRYRLFLGYLLFYGQTDDALAAAIINRAAKDASGKDRQEALVVSGQLHERKGEANAAVDAYLAAVDAGLPMADVAHHLARVYRVDIASILPPKETSEEYVAPADPMRIEISTHLPAAPAPDLDPASEARALKINERQGSRFSF